MSYLVICLCRNAVRPYSCQVISSSFSWLECTIFLSVILGDHPLVSGSLLLVVYLSIVPYTSAIAATIVVTPNFFVSFKRHQLVWNSINDCPVYAEFEFIRSP